MAKFYFTFGTDPEYPYRGGWEEIDIDIDTEQDELKMAMTLFNSLHPSGRTFTDANIPVLNCARIFTEKSFNATNMRRRGNHSEYCHKKYKLTEVMEEA